MKSDTKNKTLEFVKRALGSYANAFSIKIWWEPNECDPKFDEYQVELTNPLNNKVFTISINCYPECFVIADYNYETVNELQLIQWLFAHEFIFCNPKHELKFNFSTEGL